MDRTYKGVKISKNVSGQFVVHGFAWGDGAGENVNTFKTLKVATAFIDQMIEQSKTA